MTTLVNFELGQLLANKNYPMEFITVGEIKKVPTNIPTIAEVVMWLYEKHGIWISVNQIMQQDTFTFEIDCSTTKKWQSIEWSGDHFETPTEAYQEAIKYTLTNLL